MAIDTITAVDPLRRGQWLMPSAIRRVNPRDIRYLLPLDPEGDWHQGDLILGRVEGRVGLIDRIQNVNRGSGINYREASLFSGSVTMAVLAPRAGTSTCIARVPPRQVRHLHLHGMGGQAALIEPGSEHTALYRGAPTTLKVIALLGGEDMQRLSMRSYGLRVPRGCRKRMAGDPPLILVVGSDMDAGKSTTARRIIYALRAMGHKVVAGKACGVGSIGDISSMFDAGASEVVDFADLGEPVTIGLAPERVIEIFHQIVGYLYKKAGPDGYVVVELADGIWYPETRCLLEDPGVRGHVRYLVFACHSILDAEHGLQALEQWGYGEVLRAISGKFGSSGVLRAMSEQRFGCRWPVFDSLDYDASPERVAALFTG